MALSIVLNLGVRPAIAFSYLALFTCHIKMKKKASPEKLNKAVTVYGCH
jgi:hypothetical protein